MRWSNLWTDWMGQGHRKCAPGPAGLARRPKVVTTASSVLRTWKRNRSRMKINSDKAPTAMRGLRFMFGVQSSFRLRGRQRNVEDVVADFVLHVQEEDFLRVGREQPDEFSGAAAVAGERLQIGPLRVNLRRRLEGRHLVGEER